MESSAQLCDGSQTVGLQPPKGPSGSVNLRGAPFPSHLGAVYLFPLGLPGLFQLIQESLGGGMACEAPGEPASASLARSS